MCCLLKQLTSDIPDTTDYLYFFSTLSAGDSNRCGLGRALGTPVKAPTTPTILLDTPSSQAWLSDASIASYAGQDLARVSQGDQHEAAAHTHAKVAGQTVSLYTHSGGITAHAANGPVSLRAHTDELQILADKDVTILSVNGEIHISAQSKIELIGADSGVILDGGDITFVTPGTWEAKGATQAMLGGASAAMTPPHLPTGLTVVPQDTAQFRMVYHDGEPMAGASYTATLSDGSVRQGRLDAAGFAQLDDVPAGTIDWTVQADPRAFEKFKLPIQPDDDTLDWMGGQS